LLRGLGASLALPSLEIMGAQAPSAGGKAPQRLISIFQPNGVFPEAWNIDALGPDHELSPILAPLKSHLGEFSVIQGLDNSGQGHVQLTSAFLTGCPLRDRKNGVSLDQQVARKIGHHTTLPSLELGTEAPRQGNASGEPIAYANTVTWNSETTRVSPEIHPQVAFDRLFRENSGPEARRAALNRKSVIDLVLEDAKSLRGKASTADQAKLDEYLDSVRAVEVRVDKVLNPPERDWSPLTQPAQREMERPPAGIPHDRAAHLKIMIDLMVLALWTDSTRVATLMTAHGFSRQSFSFLDGVTSDHHGMSHHKNKPETVAEYTTVSRWYISQLSYLMTRLAGIDEGENTLLGNSILLYGSGMKDGNGHTKKDLPLLVAGRGGGAFKQGHLLQNDPGTPHANLLLTIGQGLGLEQEEFNQASSGVVDGLLV